VSITDQRGRELDSGRDIRLLGKRGASTAPGGKSALWKKAQKKWEQEGLTDWDLDRLPVSIPVGPHLFAYPAFAPGNKGVNIRLFEAPDRAEDVHKQGVQTLLTRLFSKDLKFLKRNLSLPEKAGSWSGYFGGNNIIEKALYDTLTADLFQKDLRSRKAFDAQVRDIRQTMMSKGRDLREKTMKVLEAYHETRSAIHAIEKGRISNRAVLSICSHIRKDLDALIPPDFLERYPADRLDRLPRYLKAMRIRCERGANDPAKDRLKAKRTDGFIKAHNKMIETLSPHASKEKKEALEHYRWMIEEFKVSLYAQELGTRIPVSEKRLDEKRREIERMV
jgi:ATP-dependent helicase HrpA